jgi:hypothetical protein
MEEGGERVDKMMGVCLCVCVQEEEGKGGGGGGEMTKKEICTRERKRCSSFILAHRLFFDCLILIVCYWLIHTDYFLFHDQSKFPLSRL